MPSYYHFNPTTNQFGVKLVCFGVKIIVPKFTDKSNPNVSWGISFIAPDVHKGRA